MTSDPFLTVSGLALVVGGALATLGWLLFAALDPDHAGYERRSWLPWNFLIILGGTFTAMGLPGFYATYADRGGVLGILGFVVLFVGVIIPNVAVHSIETSTMPDVPRRMMVWVAMGAPSELVGAVLTSIALLVSGAYPAWLPILMLAAVGLNLAGQLRRMPARYTRGFFPALLTVVVSLAGILLLVA